MENEVSQFKSIQKNTDAEFKDKGSKFIAYIFPISSEVEIKNHIDNLKSQHSGAAHFCYAFRLGINGEIYRANDDGEPSGSAGKPILNQLLSFEVTNILAVVVRYFGGTKLGVSGLINAYKEATSLALSNAVIVTKDITFSVKIVYPYDLTNEINQLLNLYQAQIINQSFSIDCQQLISISIKYKSEVENHFSSIEHLGLKFEFL